MQEALLNPIHAIGSKPAITERNWLHAQAKLYQEMGLEAYFDKLFEVLDNLSRFSDMLAVPEPLTKTAEKTRCKEIGPFRYFPELMGKCKRKFGHLVN